LDNNINTHHQGRIDEGNQLESELHMAKKRVEEIIIEAATTIIDHIQVPHNPKEDTNQWNIIQ